ncbi:hypothetical protein QUF75_11875 [Desulfococcaceae bacterium HSG7]|nr:hypothetical protein [Desulfococcaceae bacterium HSG7]
MKKLSREINIFNISALDLFAAAMGAFLIIAVILFPYYMKNSGPVRKAIDKLTKEIDEVERQRDRAVQEILTHKEKIAGLQNENIEAVRQQNQANQKVRDLKQEIAELNTNINKTERQQKQANQKVRDLKQEIAELNTNINETEHQQKQANQKVRDLKQEIAELNTNINKTERQQKQANQKVRDLKQEITKLNTNINKTERQQKQANQKVRALEKEIARLKKQKKQLQTALKKPVDQTLLSLTKKTNRIEVQNKQLKKEKNQLEKRANQKLQVLKKKIDRLNQYLQACKPDEPTVKFALFGIPTRADSFVVLVDMSESMKQYADSMQATVRQLIGQLDSKITLQMIGYRDLVGHVELHYWPQSRKLEPMTANAKRSVNKFATTLVPKFYGFTPTYAALKEALRYNADAIILITDGDPTDSPPQNIIRNITSQNGGKKEIHCVALGDYCNMPRFTAFLQELARRNKGGFLGMPK